MGPCNEDSDLSSLGHILGTASHRYLLPTRICLRASHRCSDDDKKLRMKLVASTGWKKSKIFCDCFRVSISTPAWRRDLTLRSIIICRALDLIFQFDDAWSPSRCHPSHSLTASPPPRTASPITHLRHPYSSFVFSLNIISRPQSSNLTSHLPCIMYY